MPSLPTSRTALAAALLAPLLLLGCKATPTAATAPVDRNSSTPRAQSTPPRPTVPPPPFRVFHHDLSSITLVTAENATDEQIEALIWQLRDAAHTRTLDKLPTIDKHPISQKLVDDRKPIVWFHIYRGPKCAAEKYAAGQPPCGASYHAAGDFTFGSYKDPNHDDGVLLHDEDHQTALWTADTLYAPPGK